MESLLGEHVKESYKYMVNEVHNILRKDTWEAYIRKSVAYHQFFPGTH